MGILTQEESLASRGEGDERSAPGWQLLWEKCFALQNVEIKASGHSLLSSRPSLGSSVSVQSSFSTQGRGGFLQPYLISNSLPPLSLLSWIKYFERKQMGML